MSLDNIIANPRNPQAVQYVAPPGCSTPGEQIDTKRFEELSTYTAGASANFPENVAENNNQRVARFPQIVPRLTSSSRFFNVAYTATPKTRQEVIDRSTSDNVLIPPNVENLAFAKLKASLNIFAPSGRLYLRSNGAPHNAAPSSPPWPLVTTNKDETVNNLSNAGTNYYAT